MATLDLINLTKRFGDVAAVNEVSLSVEDGEFLCILGPSGCGKSTALRMIGGFEEATEGDVRIDGKSVLLLPPNHRPTAMVFQKYTLWPHMRIYDNIAFGLRLRRLGKAEIDREVQEALDLVGLPAYSKRYPSQLSGGEQQRIALARALVLKPSILLLDEPFSNLDALLRVRLREQLRAIQRRVRITAIFVTHDQEEALSLADRIAVMNKGRIEQVGQPSHIYACPRTLFVADFIGTMNLLPATRGGAALQVGEHKLSAPPQIDGEGRITVAIRPEDLALVAGNSPMHNDLWTGSVIQSIDLGHYRRAIVDAPGLGVLKITLAKSILVNEGDSVRLYPTRYLVYQNDEEPVEMRQQLVEGAVTFQ
jgi:putative spermidine/putrescine transport system ATP-binding protein